MTVITFFLASITMAQQVKLAPVYRAILYRQDSNEVVFNMESRIEKGKLVLYVINDTEKIRVTDLKLKDDSILFAMPVFESRFAAKINRDKSLEGVWIKGTRGEPQYWPFRALPGQEFRFRAGRTVHVPTVSGKWVVTFVNPDSGRKGDSYI